jgi:hypothetical protein
MTNSSYMYKLNYVLSITQYMMVALDQYFKLVQRHSLPSAHTFTSVVYERETNDNSAREIGPKRPQILPVL